MFYVLKQYCLWIFDQMNAIWHLPFDPESRMYWLYWLTFVLLAIPAYIGYYQPPSGRFRWISFIRFCFPKAIYGHPSSRMDYKIFVLNRFFMVFWLAVSWSLLATVTIAGSQFLQNVFGRAPKVSWNAWTLMIFSICIALVNDFAAFLNHTMHHFSSVLWPFHSVHHSAEVLNPITLYRQHPIYMVLGMQIKDILRGIFQGVVYYFFFGTPTLWTIWGVNGIYVFFSLIGVHLRHSHIWFSYGPLLSYLFISPAQHQIHHSVAKKHRNKNMGEVFAIWDWIFGTLYVPSEKEEIVFGIEADTPQIHPTLWKAYMDPLIQSARAIKKLFLSQKRNPLAIRE
ncbi:MAG: sterol desaturase family protein [Planctomycetota bacterium]